jgi:hypothetical protein
MKTTARRTLFIATLLLSASAWAGTEVVKCTDSEGRVTLTDRPCGGGAEETVLVAGPETAAETAAPVPRSAPARPYAEGVLRASRLPSYKPLPTSRILARDVATLKAAVLTMHLLDGPAARQRRIAAMP